MGLWVGAKDWCKRYGWSQAKSHFALATMSPRRGVSSWSRQACLEVQRRSRPLVSLVGYEDAWPSSPWVPESA